MQHRVVVIAYGPVRVVYGPVRLDSGEAHVVVQNYRQRMSRLAGSRAVDVAVADRRQHDEARVLRAERLAEHLPRLGGLGPGIDEPAGTQVRCRAAAEHDGDDHEQARGARMGLGWRTANRPSQARPPLGA
jgi:hypothetical protein